MATLELAPQIDASASLCVMAPAFIRSPVASLADILDQLQARPSKYQYGLGRFLGMNRSPWVEYGTVGMGLIDFQPQKTESELGDVAKYSRLMGFVHELAHGMEDLPLELSEVIDENFEDLLKF